MILLTGFEPFGSLSRNPSADAVAALDGTSVRGVVLPVDYARLGPRLEGLLAERWDAVVLTGVAVGRPALALEKVAINYRERGRRDNAGRAPEREEVLPGGPAAYFARLPVERLSRELEAIGVPAEVSLSAGAYLCNAAFYLALHRLDGSGTPCGFVHVPATPELAQAGPSLPLEVTLRGLRHVLADVGARLPT